MHNAKTFLIYASKYAAIFAAISILSGCAKSRGPAYQLAQNDDATFHKPLRQAKQSSSNEDDLADQAPNTQLPSLSVIRPPQLSVGEGLRAAEELVIPKLTEDKVTRQSFSDLPIPVFINEVYGNQLGLDFVIQPSIRTAPDLVTLRLNSLLTQKDFYILATKTLSNFGVSVFEQDNVLVFDYIAEAANGQIPIIVTGNALPEVPAGNRPIFYIYPVSTVTANQIRGLLLQMFNKKDLTITEDINRNALILRGKPQKVRQAVEAAKLFDQPSMSGMASTILQPTISTIEELTSNLEQILQTEGFTVRRMDGNAPIKLLPLESTGQLIVFTKSQEVLDYVIEWAERLETQRQEEVKRGIFSYQVQSTQASHILNLLGQLGLSQTNVIAPGNDQTVQLNSADSTSFSSGQSEHLSGRYALDEQLNTILFSGSGKEWLQALSMIKRMDKPAPSVLIEVILAEVSLEESEESAIEWLFNSTLGSLDVVGSTLGNLGVSGGGFNINLSNGGQTRAALNFLYDNSRSTIRSRPRLMVKSGQEASIDVGDRVPIITQNATSTVTDNPQTLQSISYQETGVLLDIKPTVHATGMVDIEISQELSEAVNTDSSAIDSPTIRTRSIKTTLSLRDGGSVLIGGLIRSNDSNGEKGVPVLGRLPLIGNLFSGESMEQRRTELMIMVIPYILNSPEEAESLTDELQEARMELINSY